MLRALLLPALLLLAFAPGAAADATPCSLDATADSNGVGVTCQPPAGCHAQVYLYGPPNPTVACGAPSAATADAGCSNRICDVINDECFRLLHRACLA